MSSEIQVQSANIESIKDVIYEVRGQKVMLDYDLASIYGVKTGSLNQAVKRNIDRFPNDFMFKLTEREWMEIERNIQISNMQSQNVTASPNRRNKSNPPYAFTEHGAVMLAQQHYSGVAGGLVLNSGAYVGSLGPEQRHALALHVGAHQSAVRVVVL